MGCLVCGMHVKSSLIQHLERYHDMTTHEYLVKHPHAKILSDTLKDKFSKNMSGENNPAFNHGGKLSAFSKNYKHYEHLTEEEKLQAIVNMKKKSVQPIENRPTRIEYYIKRGATEEEAKQLLSVRQTTFSLDTLLSKHDPQTAHRIFNERQEKWLTTLSLKSPEEIRDINRRKQLTSGNRWSNTANSLFARLGLDGLWAKNGGEVSVPRPEGHGHYYIDYVLGNRAIEFNGDYWHANPKQYAATDVIRYPRQSMLAEEVWAKDELKLAEIRKRFEVLVIWEHEFKTDPEQCIQKCKEFLTCSTD